MSSWGFDNVYRRLSKNKAWKVPVIFTDKVSGNRLASRVIEVTGRTRLEAQEKALKLAKESIMVTAHSALKVK